MKKILFTLTVVSFVMLTACGNNENETKKNNNYMKPLSESMNNEVKAEETGNTNIDQSVSDASNASDTIATTPSQSETVEVLIKDDNTDNAGSTDGEETVDASMYKPLFEENDESETDEGPAFEMKGILVHEDDYTDPDAREEIAEVQNRVSSSNAWNEYTQYKNGSYAIPIEEYNIVRDGGGGYVLNYYLPGAFRSEIRMTGDEIGVYLLDDNMEKIETFLQ